MSVTGARRQQEYDQRELKNRSYARIVSLSFLAAA
jgi:hypothetical protein